MKFLLTFLTLGLVCTLASGAFPQKTNGLIGSLNTCKTKTQADIDCITSTKDGLQRVSRYIQKVRDLKNRMQSLYNGLTSTTSILGIAGKLPGVGPAVRILKIFINRTKPGLRRGLDRVKAIDAKIYPWKSRADNGVRACDQAIRALIPIRNICDQGQSGLVTAKSCITAMPSGSLKTILGAKMEALGQALQGKFNELNTALGNVGAACGRIRQFTEAAKRWPNLDGIKRGVDAMYNKLRPILSFFNELRGIINRRVCINLIFRRLCFSVGDVLNGVNGIIGRILRPLNNLINRLVSKAPSFNLPGLPNLRALFNFNLNINMPGINFNINTRLLNQFRSLNWQCGIQVKNVCQARRGIVSFNCAKPLSSY